MSGRRDVVSYFVDAGRREGRSVVLSLRVLACRMSGAEGVGVRRDCGIRIGAQGGGNPGRSRAEIQRNG